MSIATRCAVLLIVLGLALRPDAAWCAGDAAGQGVGINFLSQSRDWTPEARRDFYARDQGSRIMPLAWMAALEQGDGRSFLGDGLARYGYLPNPDSPHPGLPVGFTVASSGQGEMIGMTCSACHTRQISYRGQLYRIDGGPAVVDFGSFLLDLDAAVAHTLADADTFARFAGRVQGSASEASQASLRAELTAWELSFHTIISRSLPKPFWGPGRLDAVSMIFNRLSGLDIGPSPDYIIADNVKPANAPVRYPFLWNAWRQDHTQWPGFANNGERLLGLSRNMGEVIGVFADFHPRQDPTRLLGVDYVSRSSVNYQGLDDLEKLIARIPPPRWPWSVDRKLAAQGRAIYAAQCGPGCHEVRKGAFRTLDHATWATPIQNVGTDTREWSILSRSVHSGALTGAAIPFYRDGGKLEATEMPINLLGTAVIGGIVQNFAPVALPSDIAGVLSNQQLVFSEKTAALAGAFQPVSQAPQAGAYESRVLQGIWAAAPYLHNGSVPTLAELLKPPAERVARFTVGPEYDPVNIGIAVQQTAFTQAVETTDQSEQDSGNCRCGHDFGTRLPAAQKKALLEYLKTL